MKYRFMKEYRMIFRIKKMCKVLKASRSGYYNQCQVLQSKVVYCAAKPKIGMLQDIVDKCRIIALKIKSSILVEIHTK